MTEEEAKTKHCCGPEGTGSKGPPDNDGTCDRYCIGSACMAWQWIMWPIYGDAGVVRGLQQSNKGFCGLAGKP